MSLQTLVAQFLPVLLQTSVAGALSLLWDHRIEFAMVHQPSSPDDPVTDADHHLVLFPARFAVDLLNERPAQSGGRPMMGPQLQVSTDATGQIVVLEVVGRLRDVVGELDQAIQMVLADEPRGVVCDLSAVLEGVEPADVDVLATAGRHVRDWPGIPVAMACPDPRLREMLAAHPSAGHLIAVDSMSSAVSATLATPTPAVEGLRLAPHPTARRASREFVTRTLLDWGLDRLVLSAGLVVSELVANATMDASTDIDISVAWDLRALRLTVRDNGPELPRQPYSHCDPHGRRLSVIAVLSRAFGVLPTADGGKVVWAVLNDARRHPSGRDGDSVIRSRQPRPRRAIGGHLA